MKMVTVSQAKSQLSAYIKFAEAGEQVVIMRGSKPAALLRPISEKDLNLAPELSLSTLGAFEKEIAHERKKGSLRKLGNKPAEAAEALGRQRNNPK
jgi:antitoxin (DNA-binding transcriptional repressor) of toxin-antitoxin stability system